MVTDTAWERITDALRDHGCNVRGNSAQCPAHEDRNASLSITPTDGSTLVYCHAGCDTRDVLAELGLTKADLYDTRSATYRYDDGRTVYRTYDNTGKKTFKQTGAGATSTLYHASRLADIPAHRSVYLVEGEADVHTIEKFGGYATTAPQGAKSFHKVDPEPLRGRRVIAVVDKDDAGDAWAQQVRAKLEPVVEKLRFVHAKAGKDASNHFAAGYGFEHFEAYEPPTTALTEQADSDAPAYGDVTALLANSLPDPPQPDILHRADGNALLYRGKVNVLYGDSEGGKTWIALAAAVEALATGGTAAIIDLDHNGMAETVTRTIQLGAKPADLSDPNRFRYCEPEDHKELDYFVTDIAAWAPDVAVVDSLGEILPMLGLSSNSPDEYTHANRRVLTPLAKAGAAVIAIDHLPKDDAARQKGQTGTLAKKRAINGASLQVTVAEQFTPGRGGSANLVINKDRPGGLRKHCPAGKSAPAGRFVMTDPGDGTLNWRITTPDLVVLVATGPRYSDADLATVLAMPEEDRTKRKVATLLHCRNEKALAIIDKARELQEHASD